MSDSSMTRTRWSAIGAAVAVSIGAGGVGLINATSPDGAAAFVPITPCRLFDTRPAPHTVGARTAPVGPDEVYDILARGEQGDCEVPNSAVGVVLNVTAVDATQETFLTFFPTGEDRPTASHLNPSPGAPPAPNAVTVDLSASGEFSVFNRFGNVHVLADVVGYYTDHHHDDRYYTEVEVDAIVAAAVAGSYTNEEIDTLLAAKADVSAVNDALATKADSAIVDQQLSDKLDEPNVHGYLRSDNSTFHGTGVSSVTYNGGLGRWEITLSNGSFNLTGDIINFEPTGSGCHASVNFISSTVITVRTTNNAGTVVSTCSGLLTFFEF